MKISELYPPGAIPSKDDKTRTFLDRVDTIFGVIIERIADIFSSTPENKKGPLYADWKRITGSASPGNALRRRCDYHGGINLSNTKEHFKSVNPEDRIIFSPNKVSVYLKRPIIIGQQRSGMRIGSSLRSFKRPEEVIKGYEKMRHAHIIMEYKNA